MCHLYLTKSQYKSEFHVYLKSVITRTHYRWKNACEKRVYVKACVTQARTTIGLYRLSLTKQSNNVLKQVAIVYKNYPHCHNYPKREVLIRCLFIISQGFFIDWRHFYYIPTYKYIALAIIISNLFVSCFAIFQMIENKHGHGHKYIITWDIYIRIF